jgi:hypothetical protein
MNMNSKGVKDGPQANKIGVRLKTKRKYERIARKKRWSLVETADAVVDAYLERMALTEVNGGGDESNLSEIQSSAA